MILDLFLLAHLLFAWQAVSSSDTDAIAQQRAMLAAAQIASRPLQGIDQKLVDSTQGADSFYQGRLPYAFSQVLTELGALTSRENVRLSRVQYAYQPVLSGPSALTEVRMDASIAGEYRGVLGAINALERDHLFFTISSITLSGQQTGQVNLRLRLNTYLRAPGPNEVPGQAPANITVEPASDAGAASAGPVSDTAPGVGGTR